VKRSTQRLRNTNQKTFNTDRGEAQGAVQGAVQEAMDGNDAPVKMPGDRTDFGRWATSDGSPPSPDKDHAVKKAKKYWIKERRNPQLGTYYVACGQMSQTAARQYEKSIYGSSFMYGFDTESEYNSRLKELREDGETVQ
jgi:hypothetical protein